MSLGAGLVAFGLFFVLFFGIALVVEIFFLLNLQETLRRVGFENRRMTPGLVWLIIIPVFGMFWFIYAVVKITDSLRAEYRSRGWQPEGDFGYGVGLAAGIINVAGLAWQWIPHRLAAVGMLLSVGYIVCFVMYWVRTARMKARLGPATRWGTTPGGPYSDYGQPPAGPGGGQGWAPPYAGGRGSGPVSREADSTDDRASASSSGDDARYGFGGSDRQKRCAACGTPVTPDDKYCRGCGTSLP